LQVQVFASRVLPGSSAQFLEQEEEDDEENPHKLNIS
jgi:hypothetical protein